MYTEEFWKWVDEHRNDDPSRLRLKTGGREFWMADAICQIENERKARKKLPAEGVDKSVLPRLMTVGIALEQCTSTRMALIHREIASRLNPEPKEILDMTCGLGIDASILATLPGSHVTAIERDERIARVATQNYASRENMEIICGDSVEYLERCDKEYDLIFIDPARRDAEGKRVYNIHDCTPDISIILPLLRKKGRHTIAKLSPMLDISQTIRDLPGIIEIYVTGEMSECRELVGVIGPDETEDVKITALTGDLRFEFTQREESEATERYALPTEGTWLLEPSAPMMKAGPFKLTGVRYGIAALHPNTHVYVASDKIVDFPGRQSQIIDVMRFTSGNLKRLKKEKLQGDVAVRNFPITADELRNRLGIKKSGQLRIIGATASDGEQYLILTRQ